MKGAIYKLTREDRARTAAERWQQQYCLPARGWTQPPFGNPEQKHRALVRLGENPTPDDVDRVIGNDSWTRLECDVCETSAQALVVIELLYERRPTALCGRCAGQAVHAICQPDKVPQ